MTTFRRIARRFAAGLLPFIVAIPGTGTVQAQSAANFDINRYSTAGAGWFETFYANEEDMQSLQALLDAGTVSADMNVLVTKTALGNLALSTSEMAYHHIAQGTAGGKDWMATF